MKIEINLMEKIEAYKRVLTVSRKPDKEEFETSAKICGMGIALIGIIGFVIFVLFRLI